MVFSGITAYGIGATNSAAAITAAAPVAAVVIPYIPAAAVGIMTWKVIEWFQEPPALVVGVDELKCSACGQCGGQIKKKKLDSGSWVLYFSKCGHTIGVS